MTELHTTVTTAYIQGDELVLEDFHESDDDVVEFVRESADAEGAVHRCLAMGARALRLAGATLDGDLVEHRFDAMSVQLGHAISGFTNSIDVTTERLLGDESGVLATALERWLDDVTSTLDSTFDETSKLSAIAKLEKVLETARTQQVKAVRVLLDPDNDESPLAGWRREIVDAVERRGKALEESIAKLREQLAIKDAVNIEAERGTQKGRDFETEVVDAVTEIVRHLEDVPEHTGDQVGSSGSKVGDLIVLVSAAHTPGRAVRYVLEAKDTRLTLKATLHELGLALRNRDADAAVMVFGSQAACPVTEPFQIFGNKALVVFDRKSLDRQALRLACLWARWTACREIAIVGAELDTAHICELIDQARRALKTSTTIRGSHTKAKKAIDDAGRQLGGMIAELETALIDIEAEVKAANPPLSNDE